jgi:hypothetical protein
VAFWVGLDLGVSPILDAAVGFLYFFDSVREPGDTS